MFVLTVLFLVVLCLYVLPKRLQVKSLVNWPPELPGRWPVVGHTLLLAGDSKRLWKTIIEITKQTTDLGGVVHCKIAGSTYYIITDPDDNLTAANACVQKHTCFNFAKSWLGDGLVTGPVPIWKRHRKLLTPAFGQPVIDSFLSVFNAQARKMVDKMAKEVGNGPFHHSHYLEYMALESIYQTAFGIDPDFQNDDILDVDSYMHAVQEILNIFTVRFQKFWLHSDKIYNLTKLKKREIELVHIMRKMYNAILKAKKRTKLELNNTTGINPEDNNNSRGLRYKAFLDLLMELSEAGELNDQEIFDEVSTIVVAGHDTSANVLTYTLMLLGTHSDVQEKLFNELKEVFQKDDRDVEKYDLSQLVYTEAVIKESMRLYPMAPVILRHLDKDVKLKNYTMLAGSYCLLYIYGSHRHPVWGPDVTEFKPDRWLDPAGLPVNLNTFAGFGLGKRGCIGKTYGMVSMKTTLAHMLRHYRITADITKLHLKLDVMIKPVSGHYISIERRNS